MPMIDADGCKINVEIEGRDGAPVLMLSNSLGIGLHMWDDQVKPFTEHFRLVRYDSRGHGKSDAPKGPYNMERLSRDVLAVLDALKIEKVSWCGLSMGGMVGMWLGANAPQRVEKLVLSNTTSFAANPKAWDDRIKVVREKGLPAIADGTMERWFTEGYRQSHRDKVAQVRELFLKTNPQGYVASAEAVRDMDHREIIRKITAPTLVIAGQHDTGAPVEAAEFIQSRIPGAKLTVLDAAHVANIEKPRDYADAVIGFLTKH